MLELSVFAASIANLTDARYFAAFGVDWMGFDINPASDAYISTEDIIEIIQWVEGPKFILQGVNWNPAAAEILKTEGLKIEAVLLDQPDDAFSDMGLQSFSANPEVEANYLICDNVEEMNKQEYAPDQTYVSYTGDVELVKQLLSLEERPGLMLTGGAELEVGLKAFDSLDQVFDLIY